jgi:hypothetical protein
MRRKFFFALFACLVALLSAANIFAQSVDASAQSMLPDKFASWETDKQHPPYVRWPRSDAAARLDSHPEYTKLLVESGLVRVEDHYYQKGGSELTVGLFKLRDPSGAYEVYTSRLQLGMVPGHIKPISAMNSHNTIILAGNLLLEVTQGASDEDLRALVEAMQSKADKTPLPPIREYLPKEDLVNATQRYALGPTALRTAAESVGKPEIAGLTNAVGFAQGAEVMLAQYHHGRDSGVLLLIDYPTPQLAELHSRHLETALAETAKDAGTKIERRGSLLSIVIAPSSPAYAESLRGAVNYETQVTWNEPSATATDPPWAVVLYRIFIGTGVFMIMAVAFGVAFGGFRIFVKKLLPGKVFDRPEQMEVLQLGLSGNKIDTRDLY